MKRLTMVLMAIVLVTSIGFTKEENVATVEVYQAKYQTLIEKQIELKKKYVQNYNAIEVQLIGIEAVIDFLRSQEK